MSYRVRKNLLTLSLAAGVAIYHLANWPVRETLRRPSRQSHLLSLDFGHQSIARIRVPSQKIPTKMDAASTQLGEAGYSLRYALRQFPFDMFAVHGRPLRLYHRDHIPLQFPDVQKQAHARVAGFQREAVALRERLKRKGVETVVFSIPTPLSIERKRGLSGTLPPERRWGDFAKMGAENAHKAFDGFYDQMRDFSVDGYRVFEDYLAQNPRSELFIPYDFHWSSEGIAVAAKAVIDRLREMGWNLPSPHVVATDQSQISYARTLLGFLQLAPGVLRSRPEFQFRETFFDLAPQAPKKPGRLIVAGTSYSLNLQDQKYGFADLLGRFLQREVIVSAYHGGGSRGCLVELEKNGFQFRPGDLLVWELPMISAYHATADPLPSFEKEALRPASPTL